MDRSESRAGVGTCCKSEQKCVINVESTYLDFVNTIILSPFLFTFVSGSEMLSPSLWASPGRYLAQPAWLMPGEPGPMAQGRPRDTVVTLRIVSPDIVTRPGYQARPWRPWEMRQFKVLMALCSYSGWIILCDSQWCTDWSVYLIWLTLCEHGIVGSLNLFIIH